MDGKWAEFAQAAGGSLTNWATPCIVLDRSNKIGKTINLNESRLAPPPPSECGRQRTLNIVHAQTAALQQSNGSYEARMSGKCGEWRYYFIMTLSPINWVPVQDKGSKILCVKLGAMKVTPSDPLHQEYLTINLGSTSD